MTLKRKGQRGRKREVRKRDAAYFYPVCLCDDWLISQRESMVKQRLMFNVAEVPHATTIILLLVLLLVLLCSDSWDTCLFPAVSIAIAAS